MKSERTRKSKGGKLKRLAIGTSILAGAYMIASAPKPGKRKKEPSNCQSYAHRGLFGGEIPENSLAAFSAAIDKGFAIELDVRQSADGTLYVFHDDDVQRMCGVDRKFKEMSDFEIDLLRLSGTEHHIPRFDEVLSLVNGTVPLLVELKGEMGDKTLCPAVAARLDAYTGEYSVESFNSFLMGWYKHNRPKIVRGQLYTDINDRDKKLGLFADSMLINSISRPDFIAYDIKHDDKLLLKFCLKVFHPKRFVWTVTDNETYNKYYNDGMTDGIIFEGFLPEEKNERRL